MLLHPASFHFSDESTIKGVNIFIKCFVLKIHHSEEFTLVVRIAWVKVNLSWPEGVKSMNCILLVLQHSLELLRV